MVFEDVRPINTSQKPQRYSVRVGERDENNRPKFTSITTRRQSQAVIEALQDVQAISAQRRTSTLHFEPSRHAANFRGSLVGDQVLELEQFSKVLKTKPQGLASICCCSNKVAALDSVVEPQESGLQRTAAEESPLLVRLFRFDTDIRQLIDLERAADRKAGYAAASKPDSRSLVRCSWYDEECICLVAFANTWLVGSICGAVKRLYVGGTVQRVGFAFDLLVHPRNLALNTAKTLLRGLVTEFTRRQADWHYLLNSESEYNPEKRPSIVEMGLVDVEAECAIVLHFWSLDSIREENFISSILQEKNAAQTMEILLKRFKGVDMCPADFSEIIGHDNHQGTILVRDYTQGIESVAGLSMWECSDIHSKRRNLRSALFSFGRSQPKTRVRMLYGLYADGPKGIELLSLLVNFINNLSFAEHYAAIYCPLPSVSPLATALPSHMDRIPTIRCLTGRANGPSPKLSPYVFCDPRDF